MPKKKYEIVSEKYMPLESLADIKANIEDSSRFFIATPDITELGYNVIEWLHENPKTKGMTNAEWCAILGIALFNLGQDTARGERYSANSKSKGKYLK